MNKIYPGIIFILCGLFLSACSSTNNVTPITPQAAAADKAVVYLYRPTEMANALYSPGINIDGEFRLYAKTGASSRLSLPPGEHKFEFQSEKKYAELSPLSLKLDAGNIYYIRIDTSLKVNTATNYEPYERSFKLKQITEHQALTEIALCCSDNKKTHAVETNIESQQKHAGDGFSVDKTQNPFSH